jgi:hypothetical protein
MTVTADGKGAVFDVPSELTQTFLEAAEGKRGITLTLPSALPELKARLEPAGGGGYGTGYGSGGGYGGSRGYGGGGAATAAVVVAAVMADAAVAVAMAAVAAAAVAMAAGVAAAARGAAGGDSGVAAGAGAKPLSVSFAPAPQRVERLLRALKRAVEVFRT